MDFNFSAIRIILYAIKTVFIAGLLLFGCKKEKDEPFRPEPEPNNPPVALISVNPSAGERPLTSTIKVNGSDKDGTDDISTYILKIEALEIYVEKNKAIDTTMIFDKKGKYEVKGIVEDKAGASSEASSWLNVSEEPEPENNPPVAIVSADPSQGEAPLTSKIKVSGSDEDGIEDIKKYYLEVDKLGLNIEKANPIDTSLVFSGSGNYNVRGIVEDSKGARDSLEVLVSVSKRAEPSVNQSVSLKDFVNIDYNVSFENTSEIQLDVIKEGEKILSKNISNSGHSETFDYFSDNNFTKGFYEFVAKFKTNAGKDTSVVESVEIPNYNPEVDWSGLNIDLDESSSIIVNLPNPTDKNPEDNPVSYLPGSFRKNRPSHESPFLEFNSETNELEIKADHRYRGSYNISAYFGSSEGGFGNVQKQGTINEVLYQGYNPFVTPNLFGQGENHWENASREEKLRMLDEANMQDKSWEWEYSLTTFSCGSFSKLKAVNMFGCEDLESWAYYWIFENALENNNAKIRNGKFNIPVYHVSTYTDPDANPSISTDAAGHSINAAWVGPDNYVEKRDATDFDQWVFFEPQLRGENGTYYVKPGDFSMNDNGPVTIYWFGTRPLDGVSKPRDDPILQYQLTNGKAELDPGLAGTGINPRLIRYDPYQ